MKFDRFSAALLIMRPDTPRLDQGDEDALQDAHLAFLADLHRAGHLLAAGPLLGPPERELRGLSILDVDADRALALTQQDPAVKAGRFEVRVFPWMVPAGAMAFSPTLFPRSMEEANSG
ncbi:MAG: YciI family protein [Anaerolineales bacterium]|jgi:uncharacterized protein YciI